MESLDNLVIQQTKDYYNYIYRKELPEFILPYQWFSWLMSKEDRNKYNISLPIEICELIVRKCSEPLVVIPMQRWKNKIPDYKIKIDGKKYIFRKLTHREDYIIKNHKRAFAILFESIVEKKLAGVYRALPDSLELLSALRFNRSLQCYCKGKSVDEIWDTFMTLNIHTIPCLFDCLNDRRDHNGISMHIMTYIYSRNIQGLKDILLYIISTFNYQVIELPIILRIILTGTLDDIDIDFAVDPITMSEYIALLKDFRDNPRLLQDIDNYDIDKPSHQAALVRYLNIVHSVSTPLIKETIQNWVSIYSDLLSLTVEAMENVSAPRLREHCTPKIKSMIW